MFRGINSRSTPYCHPVPYSGKRKKAPTLLLIGKKVDTKRETEGKGTGEQHSGDNDGWSANAAVSIGLIGGAFAGGRDRFWASFSR